MSAATKQDCLIQEIVLYEMAFRWKRIRVLNPAEGGPAEMFHGAFGPLSVSVFVGADGKPTGSVRDLQDDAILWLGRLGNLATLLLGAAQRYLVEANAATGGTAG